MRILFYLILLLPFILYFIYFISKNRRLKKDELLLGLKNAPWVRLLAAGLIGLTAAVMLLTLSSIDEKGEDYKPARYENGKFIPSTKE